MVRPNLAFVNFFREQRGRRVVEVKDIIVPDGEDDQSHSDGWPRHHSDFDPNRVYQVLWPHLPTEGSGSTVGEYEALILCFGVTMEDLLHEAKATGFKIPSSDIATYKDVGLVSPDKETKKSPACKRSSKGRKLTSKRDRTPPAMPPTHAKRKKKLTEEDVIRLERNKEVVLSFEDLPFSTVDDVELHEENSVNTRESKDDCSKERHGRKESYSPTIQKKTKPDEVNQSISGSNTSMVKVDKSADMSTGFKNDSCKISRPQLSETKSSSILNVEKTKSKEKKTSGSSKNISMSSESKESFSASTPILHKSQSARSVSKGSVSKSCTDSFKETKQLTDCFNNDGESGMQENYKSPPFNFGMQHSKSGKHTSSSKQKSDTGKVKGVVSKDTRRHDDLSASEYLRRRSKEKNESSSDQNQRFRDTKHYQRLSLPSHEMKRSASLNIASKSSPHKLPRTLSGKLSDSTGHEESYDLYNCATDLEFTNELSSKAERKKSYDSPSSDSNDSGSYTSKSSNEKTKIQIDMYVQKVLRLELENKRLKRENVALKEKSAARSPHLGVDLLQPDSPRTPKNDFEISVPSIKKEKQLSAKRSLPFSATKSSSHNDYVDNASISSMIVDAIQNKAPLREDGTGKVHLGNGVYVSSKLFETKIKSMKVTPSIAVRDVMGNIYTEQELAQRSLEGGTPVKGGPNRRALKKNKLTPAKRECFLGLYRAKTSVISGSKDKNFLDLSVEKQGKSCLRDKLKEAATKVRKAKEAEDAARAAAAEAAAAAEEAAQAKADAEEAQEAAAASGAFPSRRENRGSSGSDEEN